ncbi:hypothetical protein COV18_03745 [Candidatus Woesearchaeota archaeon CG10_big_fil_rev_8_21_14_0_10_37_12]|nr:MAG: hypothetical protein COV18_03745 [Candidatus Woesearchaeota archaeon CG10_big_fil_rev_8_21_14_0_10_37_12]
MLKIKAKPYEYEFDPKHTALLVIDFQKDFLLPKGFGEFLGNNILLLQRAIEPAKNILTLFREKGLMVIHTRHQLLKYCL